MEMKFQHAGSLISLNINATFTCSDKSKLQAQNSKPSEEQAQVAAEAG